MKTEEKFWAIQDTSTGKFFRLGKIYLTGLKGSYSSLRYANRFETRKQTKEWLDEYKNHRAFREKARNDREVTFTDLKVRRVKISAEIS